MVTYNKIKNMKNNNAIMFSTIDPEDCWVCGGLVFNVETTLIFEDSYNEIKSKLESDEVINYIIEDRRLLCNLFDNDETYKFVRTYWSYGLYFVFENSNFEERKYKLSADYVTIFN